MGQCGEFRKLVAEMDHMVKPGVNIVIGDESLAPWLENTELGRMLLNNALYACSASSGCVA